MVNNAELFDMLNFEQSNKYYKPELQDNKAVVGLMKDEAAGNPIVEFVGLRPKMYSFLAAKVQADRTLEYFDKHRAKGHQRAAAAKITHDQYLAQLIHPEENYVLNRRLGSRLHKIYGIEVGMILLLPLLYFILTHLSYYFHLYVFTIDLYIS